MPVKCVVCGKYAEKENNRSVHRIPLDLKLKQMWAVALGVGLDYFSSEDRVCSEHFNPSDFRYTPTSKRLRKSAVPSPMPNSLISLSAFQDSKEPGEQSTSTSSVLMNFTDTREANLAIDSSDKSPDTLSAISLSETLTASQSTSSTLTASESPIASPVVLDSSISPLNDDRSSPSQRRHKRKSYIGDISDSDFTSPKRAKMAFNKARKIIQQKNKRLKSLQESRRRLQSRVHNLKSLLKLLRSKNILSESAEEIIESAVSKDVGELLKRVLKGPKRAKYSPELRCFALTLHFYSPRAYRYVREKFNRSLPHPSTLSAWYQSVDGSPGFTSEAITALKNLTLGSERKILCSLSVDEMAIRQKVEWSGKKFTGYVDIGTGFSSDILPQAKEVIVFLLTAVNGHFKVPVGYFFIDKLSGSEKANLVIQCLEKVHGSGVEITSLTFDGTASNFSMANILGANFSLNSMRPYFLHPITQEKVFIFLDIAHMIKLLRNCLGDKKTLETSSGNKIEWEFFEKLVSLQDSEGLVAGNKLKMRHLQWAREKMKVRIAAQTFSRSVADAFDFLRDDLKSEAFLSSEETSKFCRIVNDVFDILNSKSNFGKYIFKKPLSETTETLFLEKFKECDVYFNNIFMDNVPVLSSLRKTGFLGFLIGMESFKGLYHKYVKAGTLKFLLGYKFSQDHLNSFFSAVRSRNGFNNNPTAKQFEASFKKLLIKTEITASERANVIMLDSTTILNCSSAQNKLTCTDDGEDQQEFQDSLGDHDYLGSSSWHLTCFVENIVIYIAGFVVKCIKPKLRCSKCIDILENDKTLSHLQKRKEYGSLHKASKLVADLCILAEKEFRIVNVTTGIVSPKIKHISEYLVQRTMQNLPENILVSFGDHLFDEPPELLNNHGMTLIKLIIAKYFTIRIHHETRKMSDNVNRVRSLFTKQILFRHQ